MNTEYQIKSQRQKGRKPILEIWRKLQEREASNPDHYSFINQTEK